MDIWKNGSILRVNNTSNVRAYNDGMENTRLLIVNVDVHDIYYEWFFGKELSHCVVDHLNRYHINYYVEDLTLVASLKRIRI